MVFEDNGKYYVSQEFNGDKEEALIYCPNTLLKATWDEIPPLFEGCVTLTKFRESVRKAENVYGYEQYPLCIRNEIPRCEEVWKLEKGKLILYTKYDKLMTQRKH